MTRMIIVAVCVAASAIFGASASAQPRAAQPPVDDRQATTGVDTRAELERLRRELERAREALEAAARDVASRPVPAAGTVVGTDATGVGTVGTVVGTGGTVVFRGASGPVSPLGAILVDAEGGALVTQVIPGGAAASAGIQIGDVVQSIDGLDLSADGSPSTSILQWLMEVPPGDAVKVAVERAGDVLEYDVAIGVQGGPRFSVVQPLPNRLMLFSDRVEAEGPTTAAVGQGLGPVPGPVVFGSSAVSPFGIQPLRSLDLAASAWGEMELVTMTAGLGRYFGTNEGLLVVRGPADESIGIEDGDVILTIGGRTPSSPEHAIRILSSFEHGETIEFSLMRDGQAITVEHAVPQQSPGVRRALINRIQNAR